MPGIEVLNYVTTNRFYIEMESQIMAAFSECSGLDVQIEKEVYMEGGVNDQQRIFLKHAKFNDITLKRGITDNAIFWNWINQSLAGKESRRRNINILVFNQTGETMQVWRLLGAVAVGWKTPSLKADSNAVALEELVLAYEGLTIKHKDAKEKLAGGGVQNNLRRDKQGYFDGGVGKGRGQ
ncbi:MAG: phage tail protein [Leptolyngbyaceae cyanobacterium bins.59]|nr:phage tail protein [Leptolyngbyaceae cyanobacterium bins.59]